MELKLRILKLFLNELGCNVSASQGDVDDRMELQKTVYLGQLSGVDLGYRFGWYVKGPYCSELADSYYEMERSLSVEPDAVIGKRLSDPHRTVLASIRPLLDSVPEGMKRANWLELLASYHHLKANQRLSDNETLEVLQNRKPYLMPYVEQAIQKLIEFHKL